jgi:hypothetical protein
MLIPSAASAGVAPPTSEIAIKTLLAGQFNKAQQHLQQRDLFFKYDNFIIGNTTTVYHIR